MSYIKIKKIQKELVDIPENGYIYFGYDDNGFNENGFWIKKDDGSDSSYLLNFKPSISYFEPKTSSYSGQTLIIYGDNFITGSTSITFNGISTTIINVLSKNQLTLITPNIPGNDIPVIISTVQYGSSEPVNYTII